MDKIRKRTFIEKVIRRLYYDYHAIILATFSIISRYRKPYKIGQMGEDCQILCPHGIIGEENVFLEDHVKIMNHCEILTSQGKFIMKSHACAASHLKVDPDNHITQVGELYGEKENKNLKPGKIIVNEDVWIGMNVTLLSNVTIGRGAIIGAGTVLRSVKIPPYSIVIGNPAKVIGFRFTPEQILKHEKLRYKEQDRISKEILFQNFDKYFVQKINDIADFTSLIKQ